MGYSEDIDRAVAVHGMWKRRLSEAIAIGKSDIDINKARLDNQCDFGKWFYSLPVELRSSENGRTIQRLHAEFHTEAARILALALCGRKDEAEKSIASGSQFVSISGQMAMALSKWKASLSIKKAA